MQELPLRTRLLAACLDTSDDKNARNCALMRAYGVHNLCKVPFPPDREGQLLQSGIMQGWDRAAGALTGDPRLDALPDALFGHEPTYQAGYRLGREAWETVQRGALAEAVPA